VEVVEGDARESASLVAALTGVSKVVLSTGVEEGLPALQKAIVDASRKAGVQRMLKISAAGASPRATTRFAKAHGLAEKDLENSGMPFTVLRPSFLMQNFLDFLPTIASHNTFYMPTGEGKIALVDVRDIGGVAVKTLTADGYENRTYEVTGPEALAGSTIAHRLSLALGRDIHFVSPDPDRFKQDMLRVDAPLWNVEGMLEMYSTFAKGQGANVTDTVQTITGHPPTSFDQFAHENAQVFAQAQVKQA
jgi:uncharacterized protein YbjT (DUF2867 family)